jgi:hypothetical protein
MTPAQFQVLITAWLGVVVVLIPLTIGVIQVALRGFGEIANTWRAITVHSSQIKSINDTLNGSLDKRISDAVNHAMDNHNEISKSVNTTTGPGSN